MKMKLKIKIFPCNLYPFNIDVDCKHENTLCTLLKIVHIIQISRIWIVFDNIIIYKFIFVFMVKKKTIEPWFQYLNIHNEF
jgi:hypothetical protein